MSTAHSDPSDLQHGNSWVIDSADTTPYDSQIGLEPVSLGMDVFTILVQKLSKKQHLRDADSNMTTDDIYKILRDWLEQPDPSPVKTSRKSERSNEIHHSMVRKMYNFDVYEAGTEPVQWRPVFWTINDTKYVKSSQNLEDALVNRLNKMFDDARDEVFEDGMNNAFSDNVNRIVKIHGRATIHALKRAIHTDNANIEVIEEALKQVGNIEDMTTHDSRLNLLKGELTSHHPRIRNAASMGIEAMDDAKAIEDLQNAINNERHEQVRKNFQTVLAQLQGTQ